MSLHRIAVEQDFVVIRYVDLMLNLGHKGPSCATMVLFMFPLFLAASLSERESDDEVGLPEYCAMAFF